MQKTFVLLILILVFIVFSGYMYKSSSPKDSGVDNQKKEIKSMGNLKFPGILPDEKIKNKKAVLKTDQGTVEIILFADKAPKTVSNFIYLSENKFYDGLTFHRVVPGFVAQGGDPTGTGSGGPGYQFEDEEVKDNYKTGTVAMANSGSDTNGSQFFICLEDQPDLPKLYNLFGQVTTDMDIVKKIQIGTKIESITIENQ